MSSETFLEFNKFIIALTSIDEDIIVPFEIAFKYEEKGLAFTIFSPHAVN
jgi:hypothetical protein